MNKTVSVIIYCKNQAINIAETIRSVIDQSYNNKNVVIIDDASSDNSWLRICETLNRPDRAEDFEFKQIINNTYCFAKQNEFEDGVLRTLFDGSKVFWDQSDWFALLSGKAHFLAGKISCCMDEADENFGYIYSDYILNGFSMFEQSNIPSRIDTGFFHKNVLEKIDINKIKDKSDFIGIVRHNFLTFHVPEVLQTIYA